LGGAGAEATDDLLLLADVLTGAALMEAEGAGASPSAALAATAGPMAPEELARAQASVLARAAAMASAASAGDSSLPARALRALLRLALQRLRL